MKQIGKGKLIVGLFMVLGLISFAGAMHSEGNSVRDLAPWFGENNSFTMIFDHPNAQGLFEAISHHKPGYSPEMVKREMIRQYEGNIEQFVVTEDGRSVLVNGKTTVEYEYFGKLETRWEEYDLEWFIFLSSSPEAIDLGIRTLLLMSYHGHGEGSIPHCHGRYSNRCFAHLTTSDEYDNWWPTFYRPSEIDIPTVLEQMTRMARMLAANLPDLE